MSSLEKYRCAEIVDGIPLPGNAAAYRMDKKDNQDKQDMRAECGNLQGCSCCDYFMVWEDSIILIEDSYLGSTVGKLIKECDGVDKKREDKYVYTALRWECAVKVYGSLLMLCRLSERFPCVKNMIDKRKYKFWLVDKGCHERGSSGSFGGRGQTLSKSLEGFFGKEVENIDILLPSQLEEVLKGKKSDS